MEHEQVSVSRNSTGATSTAHDVERIPSPDTVQRTPTEEQDLTDLLAQAQLACGYFQTVLQDGIEEAMGLIASPAFSSVDRSMIWEALVFAAQISVAGAAGGAAVELGHLTHLGGTREKMVVDGCKELVKSCWKAIGPGSAGPKKEADLETLRDDYRTQLDAANEAGQQRFIAHWPEYAKGLRALSNSELAALNKKVLSIDPKSGSPLVKKRVLEGWFNFIARASYGAGAKYDPWNPKGGAYATSPGAAAEGYFGADPTAGNVDAQNPEFAVSPYTENAAYDAHTGMLEIRVQVVNDDFVVSNLRMSGLSKSSLAYIRTLGSVRDLHVNKIISLMKGSEWGVKSWSQVVTADGRLRMIDTGSNTTISTQNRLLNAWDMMEAAQRCPLQHLEAV